LNNTGHAQARIALGCLEGKPVGVAAESLQVRPNTVIEWRRRFEQEGIPGLRDRPRSGKPPRYTIAEIQRCEFCLTSMPPRQKPRNLPLEQRKRA
jgi:transposase